MDIPAMFLNLSKGLSVKFFNLLETYWQSFKFIRELLKKFSYFSRTYIQIF